MKPIEHRDCPLFRLPLLLLLFSVLSFIYPLGAGVRAQSEAAAGGTNAPGTMLPWLSPATSRPLVMEFEHHVTYDPSGPSFAVHRSRWRVDQLNVATFGGSATFTGRGEIGGGQSADVRTTLTLQTVDVQRALRFLQVPRAEEIEARVSGSVYLHILNGDWAAIEVDLYTEPDSVRLSREVIKTILGGSLQPDLIEQRVEPTLTAHFGAARMIPIRSMRIRGRLDHAVLTLAIPLRNDALNIDFEPRIDRAGLWALWEFLRDAGLRDMPQIGQWEMEAGN